MKKRLLVICQIILICILAAAGIDSILSQNINPKNDQESNIEPAAASNTSKKDINYKYPEFYRGIYLNVWSARHLDRLYTFVAKAKKAHLNTMVMDVQISNNTECAVPEANVAYCIKNNIHPIARIVVFPDGLKKYPVPENYLNGIIKIAQDACEKGFREIQFDYIRFSDYKISKKLTLEEKYNFIEGFLANARNNLEKYNVKIAVDVFGRIPLNKDDAIGQKMEVFDRVVDIICPMAYPSHYTWSEKYMSDPYQTVYITSTRAKERTRNAEIVTYIQAFNIKVWKSNLSFEKYIERQLEACHDSGIRGYILWNASQQYDVSFDVLLDYYRKAAEASLQGKDDISS